MTRPLRTATPLDLTKVDVAIAYLQNARTLLTEANAPMALAKVRKALSSAYGARRHAERRAVHTTIEPEALADL